MINYFNFKPMGGQFLLTNDLGSYFFLSTDQFRELFTTKTVSDECLRAALESEGFIFDGSLECFTERFMPLLRNSKNYVFEATQLHVFVVTTACNLQCVYCQAQNGHEVPHAMMDEDTARKAVDIALQSPSKYLSFEFQGGEPLLDFTIIKFIVEYSEANKTEKIISYSVVTNLSLISEEIADYLEEHHITVSTSLDGHQAIHEKNRPARTNFSAHSKAEAGIRFLQERNFHPGAILTTTRSSLAYAKEIVDEYVRLGLNSITLRPLTPLGCASTRWSEIGYSPEEFLVFYSESLDYIIALNRRGIPISEGMARIYLTKILDGVAVNYMELRSPCGASVGQIAYYCDGRVFTCDEGRMLAEMGNDAFLLGTVDDDYDHLMDSGVCKTVCSASILEGLPSCSDCVYQPFCGVCPAVNYALYGDLIENTPNGYRCKISKGLLDKLFGLLQNADDALIQIFRSWIK